MNNVGGTGGGFPTAPSQGGAQPFEETRAPEKVLRDPVTPEEVWSNWIGKLTNVHPDVDEALNKLAHGRSAGDGCIQAAFHLLLAAEAFDTCLDIFEAHRAVQETAAGAPVTMALDLIWPPDWNPDRAKLEELFTRLRVDSLTVDAGASTVPEAGCHCIAILIRRGLSELAIGGTLAAPEVVAKAFKGCSLRSMAFLGSPLPTHSIADPFDTARLTAGALADGLVEHRSLESLAIHDERLLVMSYFWQKLLSYRPALQTLEISLKMPDFKKNAWSLVSNFLYLVRDAGACSNIALACGPDISGLDADMVNTAILLPLKKHGRLSSLSLCHMPPLTSSPNDLKSQPYALEFALSCPKLSHFVWEAAAMNLTVDVLRAFCREGGNLLMPRHSAKVADDFVELLPRLKKMALMGHPMASGTVNALAVARDEVKVGARMDLDLMDCLVDVQEAIALAAAWKTGPTNARLQLPLTFDSYYLRERDHIWGIAENAARDGFVLSQAGDLDQAAYDRAVAAFDALTPAWLEMMRDIRQQFAQDTSPLLQNSVQAFMHAALRSANPSVSGVWNDTFALPAEALIEQLVKEESTPTLVHLSAVNADMHMLRPQGRQRRNITHLVCSTSTTFAQMAQAVETPEQTEKKWLALLDKSRHPTPIPVREALLALARDVLSDEHAMQRVFLHLFNANAFDLFAQAFGRYNSLRRAEAGALYKPPVKSSLSLELPHDWAPDVEQMVGALQRVQVDTLTLKPTESNPHLSCAACQLVATLIERGTTELILGGVLGFAQDVADAMPRSQLRTLSLLGVPQWAHLPAPETESYDILTSGALGCTTLQEVTIRDEKLLVPCLDLLYAKSQPNALEVPLSNNLERTEMPHFMGVASGLPALAKVKVHFDVTTRFHAALSRKEQIEPVALASVKAAILTPLAKSKSLTTLDMGPMPMDIDSPMCTDAAPSAFVFAASSPSLRHLLWKAVPSAPLTVQHLQAFKAAGGDCDMADTVARLTHAHARAGAKLETLSLSGFVLLPGPTQAWAATLADNRSLRRLDLSGCLMDARSAATLYASLKDNPLFEALTVSTNYSDYYFSFEGQIWAIHPKPSGDGFVLTREGEPDEALDKRVAQAFAAVKEGLRDLIKLSLAHTFQDAIDARR